MLKINDIYDIEGTKKEIKDYFIKEFNYQCISNNIDIETKLINLKSIIELLEELKQYNDDSQLTVIYNDFGKWNIFQK